jgi:hypothetical protein
VSSVLHGVVMSVWIWWIVRRCTLYTRGGRVMKCMRCVVTCFPRGERNLSGHLCADDYFLCLAVKVVCPGGAILECSCTVFLSLYDEVTNVICLSLLSHDIYQYDSLILSQTDLSIPSSTIATADMVLTSLKNAWKQIFIFPLRYNANCVSTALTVLITLKVSVSFIVTLYIQ